MSRGTVVLCNEAKETLIKHPAKKLVMDFLRVLITDALTTPPYTTTLIDTILEVRLCPRFFLSFMFQISVDYCQICFCGETIGSRFDVFLFAFYKFSFTFKIWDIQHNFLHSHRAFLHQVRYIKRKSFKQKFSTHKWTTCLREICCQIRGKF